MNPQVVSLLTSIGLSAATAIAAWAASKGLIPSADQSTIANDLVTAGGAVIAGLFIWYKRRSASPTAQIAAINSADNGVKVVASAGPGDVVSGPLK